MLDLCGRHGGTCGVSDYMIHIDGPESDSCDVVEYICLQVSEDTIYEYDHYEYDNEDMERSITMDLQQNFDVHHGRLILDLSHLSLCG